MEARARISTTVKAIVEERRRNNGESSNKKSDFLEILLSVNTLSEDEKVSFVLDSLLGGYETTSLLMTMAVQFLGQSPVALKQLKSEHQNIRSTKQKEQEALASLLSVLLVMDSFFSEASGSARGLGMDSSLEALMQMLLVTTRCECSVRCSVRISVRCSDRCSVRCSVRISVKDCKYYK